MLTEQLEYHQTDIPVIIDNYNTARKSNLLIPRHSKRKYKCNIL